MRDVAPPLTLHAEGARMLPPLVERLCEDRTLGAGTDPVPQIGMEAVVIGATGAFTIDARHTRWTLQANPRASIVLAFAPVADLADWALLPANPTIRAIQICVYALAFTAFEAPPPY